MAEIATQNDVATIQGLEGLFQNLIASLLGLAGIILFIYLVIGGVKYITSGGNPASAESAKKTITYAIFGLVAVSLSVMVLSLLGVITGQNRILNFVVTLID